MTQQHQARHSDSHGVRMIYRYNWKLADAIFTKDRGSVFSCFACGGGSTMGYKLAGFDVIGCNEIDPKLMEIYIRNHNPKHPYCEDIRTFRKRNDLPPELYNLDILDGSPPCTSFSMAGRREKEWGKTKKFREGQAEQRLDDLFFEFIALAKTLQPKVVISENVSSMLIGNAKKYCLAVYDQLTDAGYKVVHYVLNAKNFGIPQNRERVFFIGLRNDLAVNRLDYTDNIFGSLGVYIPQNKEEIPYIAIRRKKGTPIAPPLTTYYASLWEKTPLGYNFGYSHEKGSNFNEVKAHPDKPLPTIRASGLPYDHIEPRRIYLEELLAAFSFPSDYDFGKLQPKYVCGMSVPPVMMARIADAIYTQWTDLFREES